MTARARVSWLEQNIKNLSPGFNLKDGPQIDFRFMDDYEQTGDTVDGNADERSANQGASRSTTDTVIPPRLDGDQNSKRRFSAMSEAEAETERPFAEEARSVAFDLGMLSLNADSRQTHYLGSSSGRLFTSLIGVPASSSAESPSDKGHPSPSGSTIPSRLGQFASAKQYKLACRQLYTLIRRVCPLLSCEFR